MQSTATLEQTLLNHLRQLPPDKQQEVLDFAEFLRQKVFPLPPLPTQPSLQQLASLPLSQRHQALAPSSPIPPQTSKPIQLSPSFQHVKCFKLAPAANQA
jgi:hypothetical protein